MSAGVCCLRSSSAVVAELWLVVLSQVVFELQVHNKYRISIDKA